MYPWHQDGAIPRQIIDAKGEPIARVSVNKSDAARLIAAAPEMLELLRDIAIHLSGGASLHPGSLIFAEDAPAIEVIRAVIAKAD